MARTLRDIQRERQEALKLEHKQKLAKEFGLVDHPKLDKLYDVAWNFGHANGFQEVEFYFMELEELIR